MTDWKLRFDLSQGIFDTLIFNHDGQLLTFPDGIKICLGPERVGSSGFFDRVWWVYMDSKTGDIWIARSDKNYTRWEHRERLLFVPSGITNPSLAFDSACRYVVAVEFLPAGATQKEIWIYE
ncbi:MAG: hypothetical protein QM401_00685, partial [Bacillota bacterium]|nr:hypothetical protein [Bacillota bacterium]